MLLLNDWLYYLVSVLIILVVTYFVSLFVNKQLRKSKNEPKKNTENLVSFLISIAIILLYFAITDLLVGRAYEGDILFTEEEAWEVESASVRYVTTENPFVVDSFFAEGYFSQEILASGEMIQVLIKTTDYPALYSIGRNVSEGKTSMFPYQQYYESELQPAIIEALQQEEASSINQVLLAAEQKLNDSFDAHTFSLTLQ